MTNPFRNETTILIKGESKVLRPTFSVMVEIESEFGPLSKLFAKIEGGELTFAAAKTILALGLKGGGNPVSNEDLDEAIEEIGFAGIGTAVVTFLMSSVHGGQKIKKN